MSNYTKPIFVRLPFVLDEDVATLAGLMPDGSLIKDLMRIFFHQKKDLSKIKLFDNRMIGLFSSNIKLFQKRYNGCIHTYINSKTLVWFFYYILKIPKSDEQMRVPEWVFDSPKSVKIAYLREAFDMEGTILKTLREIRFVSKDEDFAKDIQKLLLGIDIKSYLTFAPRFKQKSGQYRVSIYRKENFEKFKEIGFRIPHLEERFGKLLEKYGIK